MKTRHYSLRNPIPKLAPVRRCLRGLARMALAMLATGPLAAATVTLYTQDFEGFTDSAANLADTADANPTTAEFTITDDNPAGGVAGSGVQVAGWLGRSGTKSLLVRTGSEAVLQLQQARSGMRYQLDFQLYVVKESGDRNFYVIVRAMGSDTNGEDFLAYRSDRSATAGIFYYDGIAGDGVAGWQATGAQHLEGQWQHHRFVFNMATLKFDLFIDNMNTPVVSNADLSRSGAAVPTAIILRHEGNSADDGYCAFDDIALTVEDSRDLATTFTEGFETYPAAALGSADDADPQGAWITTEADGTGDNKPLNPAKVQVVGKTVVMPRSGNQCLKIEGGQRAGVTFAWGSAPDADVQITWWARVPASVKGQQANYLRMSLYGLEDGRHDQGDCALLGYGSRDANVGDETSLTIFTTAWQDTPVDFTPDTWEQYRLTTHTAQGTYSLIKNPTGADPQVIADRAPFIGGARTWGPMLVAAWSSSNGSGHPPVYVDDIEIKSVVSNPEPLPDPYTPTIAGGRFEKVTELKVGGPVGAVAVDPRDNATVFFAYDTPSGAIHRVRKTGSGTWAVDEQPLVQNLDRPSGLVVDANGTLWWTHDYTQRLMRLQAPWENHTPETVIENFGETATDDDPIDLAIAPATFNGALGRPNWIVVADRGSDGDANNALYLVDPATTDLNQSPYNNFLVPPTPADLGSANLNAIAPLGARGEVVVLNMDGYITAVDANGWFRYLPLPTPYLDPFASVAPLALAVDPTTGRVWVADDLLDQVWSVGSELANPAPDRLELSFPLTNPSRPDMQIRFHDPGMEFAPNGAFLVVADGSTVNGGGRLLIFHSEQPDPIQPFPLTHVELSPQGLRLEWQAAGGARYRVERATQLGVAGAFAPISGELTNTSYTDTAPPAGTAFYRVVAIP